MVHLLLQSVSWQRDDRATCHCGVVPALGTRSSRTTNLGPCHDTWYRALTAVWALPHATQNAGPSVISQRYSHHTDGFPLARCDCGSYCDRSPLWLNSRLRDACLRSWKGCEPLSWPWYIATSILFGNRHRQRRRMPQVETAHINRQRCCGQCKTPTFPVS